MFQSNYALCDAFATKLAALARSPRAFWESPKTVTFYSSWEISLQCRKSAFTVPDGVRQLAVAGPDDGSAVRTAEEGGEGNYQCVSR